MKTLYELSTHLFCNGLFFLIALTQSASGEMLTYRYTGQITEVTLNENNVIPDLNVNDSFTGYVTFESAGWSHTTGTVFASLNGVDLLFTGQYIYGDVTVLPAVSYSIRIAGDTGGSIDGSTFSAGNFGPDLSDTDGSAGHAVAFPPSLNLSEFETNTFRMIGQVISTGDRISANGRLTEFIAVPEPTALWLSGATVLVLMSCYRKRIFRENANELSL